MAVTLTFTRIDNGQDIPTYGIIGVPLPEANQVVGVNQAADNYQGYTLEPGQNMTITYTSDGRIVFEAASGGGGGLISNGSQNIRMCTESLSPFNSADSSSVTSIYITPCNGNQVTFWDDDLGKDVTQTFSEINLSFAL